MCTSPLVRFRPKKFAPDLLFGGVSYYQIKSLKYLQSKFLSYSAFKSYFDEYFDYQYLNCRHCSECRISYSREWSVRCYHEFQTSGIASFITLTVDSSKVKLFMSNSKKMRKYCRGCNNGNRYIKYPLDYTLSKGFITDELKRIRDVLFKRYGVSIRYFGCGEYGSIGERPHYHLLIFGYNFPDKILTNNSSKGVPMYFSQELSDLWPYGLHTVQDVNHNACLYTAKYVTKKLHTNNDVSMLETYYGREPEFMIVSTGSCNSKRCPFIDDIIKNCKGLNSLKNLSNPYCKLCKYKRGGIGFDWISKYYRDVIKIGYCQCEGKKLPIPKYYIDLIKLTDLELYDKYKLRYLKYVDELNEVHPEYKSYEHLQTKAGVIKAKLRMATRQ